MNADKKKGQYEGWHLKNNTVLLFREITPSIFFHSTT